MIAVGKNSSEMEEVALQDWPGPPVDLSGNNSWMPAYGFQTPSALLEKDDFIGNPGIYIKIHCQYCFYKCLRQPKTIIVSIHTIRD